MFTRSLIVVEKGAKLTLIEIHESGDAQVNTALELVVGDERAGRSRQDHRRAGLALSSLLASIGAKAQFNYLRVHRR